MCDFITQCSTLPFLEHFAITVLVDSAKGYLELIEGHGEKRNILRQKLERTLLRYFFLICEFISQSYNLCLKKQFANTLFGESGK